MALGGPVAAVSLQTARRDDANAICSAFPRSYPAHQAQRQNLSQSRRYEPESADSSAGSGIRPGWRRGWSTGVLRIFHLASSGLRTGRITVAVDWLYAG